MRKLFSKAISISAFRIDSVKANFVDIY